MSTVVCSYKGEVILMPDVPKPILEKWYTRLIESADMIYQRIMTKIPNVEAYIKYLADPSAEMWRNFVSDYWPNADMIRLKQDVKVHMAGQRYINGVINAYVLEDIFQKNVALKRDRFEMARYTLSGVGIRYLEGWGPEYKAVAFITGDKRVLSYITSTDQVSGEPVVAFPPDMVKFVRPFLIARLTQGTVYALYARQAGMTTILEKIVSLVTQSLTQFCNSYKSPEYSNVEIGLEYDSSNNKLYVFAKVEK